MITVEEILEYLNSDRMEDMTEKLMWIGKTIRLYRH